MTMKTLTIGKWRNPKTPAPYGLHTYLFNQVPQKDYPIYNLVLANDGQALKIARALAPDYKYVIKTVESLERATQMVYATRNARPSGWDYQV